MMENSIRRMKLEELKDIFKLIEKDFPPGEYAPYEVLYSQLKKGVQEGLVLCEGQQDVAYSICAAGNPNGYVLVSLLAVYEEFRGKGFGSVFLEQLKKLYSNKNGLIIEVEKPENAATPEEKKTCVKRIEFYQKAGYYLVPGIDYSIWDVPMHLMVLPQQASKKTINEEVGQIIYEIYLQLMGKRYIHKLKFEALK